MLSKNHAKIRKTFKQSQWPGQEDTWSLDVPKESIADIHPHVYFYLKEVLNQFLIDIAQCYPYFESHLEKLMLRHLAIAHLL